MLTMKNIILIDLEKNPLQAKTLRAYVENDQLVYLFHLTGQFHYDMQDLTELAGWISAGLVIILDVPDIAKQELAYAMLAGQLLALTEEHIESELISTTKEIHLLIEILQSSGRQVQLNTSSIKKHKSDDTLPSLASFQAQPLLQQVKKYCDALANLKALPTTHKALMNSLNNILKLPAAQIPQLIGMLINLKIIKQETSQIHFRKKILKQWLNMSLDLNEKNQAKLQSVRASTPPKATPQKPVSGMPQVVVGDVDSIMQFLQQQHPVTEGPFPPELDELQWQVLQKLDELQHERPKDIFSLRDQLQDWFPKADIQMLMKSLLDKGYIQLNDDQLHYTAQMVIH